MPSDYDATEFVDGDFHSRPAAGPAPAQRAPTGEEIASKVAEAQQKLAELRRTQEELEQQRAALEETRRRQKEFDLGRQEMVQHLTRALGLLEEAEFAARRDAEQMAKALAGLRDAQTKIEAIHQETWTNDNFEVELTRALTALENARMEWNSARLKFPVLSGAKAETDTREPATPNPLPIMSPQSFGELCRVGFALTWPLAAVLLLGVAGLLAVLLRR